MRALHFAQNRKPVGQGCPVYIFKCDEALSRLLQSLRVTHVFDPVDKLPRTHVRLRYLDQKGGALAQCATTGHTQ